MNFRFAIIDASLNKAEFRWKWLRFLEHSFLVGSAACLVALGFGGAVLLGWVTSRRLAVVFFAFLAVTAFLTWLVLVIRMLAGAPDRRGLAAALERVDSRLLDRLNTLLFLDPHIHDARARSFADHIAGQTQGLLAEKPPPSPFPAARTLTRCLAFLLALSATVLLYELYVPWGKLVATGRTRVVQAAPAEVPLELAPPTNSIEQNQSWGEVRITDPGADLKVTKVDVVPLQIEAAANQPLKQVSWFSAINGETETPHPLAPPAEPRYAVYQPTIYLDELRLSDWDVLTYYAKADAGKDNFFASEMYFVEVRPFREDILKMPGGENGQAGQCLNEMTALITRQQQVMRQTHQHAQQISEPPALAAQDRRKLSDAETDLRDSTQHLYAKMAGEMENKPIGEALDNLARAEQSLGQAGKLLADDVLGDAQNQERNALTQLVAARKNFQKAVTDNPKDFETPPDTDASPTAESTKKLGEIAEFRDEAKVARDFVQKTLAEQKKLDEQARSGPRNTFGQLADQEQHLAKSLQDFEAQHPQVFQGTQPQSQQAQLAMAQAADALQKRNHEAASLTHQAAQDLEKFNTAMQGQSAGQQLADAYRLKQMLDRQIRVFDQNSRSNSPVSEKDLQQAARQARETLSQLKKTAEQEPTRDAFGQPLRDALNGERKVDLDAKLEQVQQAEDDATRRQRAGEAREGLARVSRAFGQSEPKSLQMAQQADALKSGEANRFEQAMAEVDSLLKLTENHHPVSPSEAAKEENEALYNLQTSLRSQSGNHDLANQILLHAEETLKAGTPLDPANLKKLLEELQNFSVETSDHLAKNEDPGEMTNIDPSRLPPAYRGRIQKYFQKLSEK